MITVRPATAADAAWVGLNLREEDEEEVQAATGSSGRTVVPASFQHSTLSFAVFGAEEKEPCALFGCSPDPANEGWGLVWFLGTPDIIRYSRDIIKEAPRWLTLFHGFCPNGLHNNAYAKNGTHLRWCLLTGFQVGGVSEHRGHQFIHIYRPTLNHV